MRQYFRGTVSFATPYVLANDTVIDSNVLHNGQAGDDGVVFALLWCYNTNRYAAAMEKAMYNFSALGGASLPEGIMTSRNKNANSTDPGSEAARTVSVSVDLIHMPTIMDGESLDIFVKEITFFFYERFQLTIPIITICGDVTITDQVLHSSEYSSLYLVRVFIDVCGSPSVSNFDERVRNVINAQGSALVRSLRIAGDDYFHNLQSLEAVDADENDNMKEDGDKTEHQFDWIIVLCAVAASFAVIGIGVSVAGLLRRKRSYKRQIARQNEIKRERNLKQQDLVHFRQNVIDARGLLEKDRDHLMVMSEATGVDQDHLKRAETKSLLKSD
eukprot:CAMPEP_0196805284 /NCGR_PEP_ID=MMETSP1362-20130617/5060_1 /TAXON_ID=163516 /ORGANISM="Leptocylindrus danicus, Strain CCMP1856" /LENGTH=329 /DNA_ID=CAMNT_0042178129 /DNA_START=341 /DNA_END=1332 /DNA_ORIENTATION=+